MGAAVQSPRAAHASVSSAASRWSLTMSQLLVPVSTANWIDKISISDQGRNASAIPAKAWPMCRRNWMPAGDLAGPSGLEGGLDPEDLGRTARRQRSALGYRGFRIRIKEGQGAFDAEFIELARAVTSSTTIAPA